MERLDKHFEKLTKASFARYGFAYGELLARWGEPGDAPGQFRDSPHGLAVDSRGDLYIAEVTGRARFQKFARQP